MGLSLVRRTSWTEEEDRTLLELIARFTVSAVARKLQRGVPDVQSRASQLKVSTTRDGYTIPRLAQAFGVSRPKVERWIAAGLLGRNPPVEGELRVSEKCVREFIQKHPRGEFDLRRVDQGWFVSVVFGFVRTEVLPSEQSTGRREKSGV
jgi:hypothetical protein